MLSFWRMAVQHNYNLMQRFVFFGFGELICISSNIDIMACKPVTIDFAVAEYVNDITIKMNYVTTASIIRLTFTYF